MQQGKLLGNEGAAQASHGFFVATFGDTAIVAAARRGATGFQSRGAPEDLPAPNAFVR